MPNIKIDIDPSDHLGKTNILTLTQDDVGRYVKACLHDSCKLIVKYAKEHHYYKDYTGNLTRAIKFRVLDRKSSEYGYIGRIYIDEDKAPYGKYQVEGTGGIDGKIKPKTVPAFNFFSKRFGRFYKNLAEVSGIKPDDFLGRAIKNNRLEVDYIFQQGLRELMKNGRV